jgi:calcineurin-like phosphoesterase family protein
VGSDTAISKVFPSKRAGYEEIYGELVFVDGDSDKTFRLVDQGDDSLTGFQEIRVDDKVYHFDYTRISQDKKVLSHFPYFSDLIGDIAGDIIDKGSCHLPLLEESISQHLLVEDILESLDHRPKIT